jgi:hypothetical protein
VLVSQLALSIKNYLAFIKELFDSTQGGVSWSLSAAQPEEHSKQRIIRKPAVAPLDWGDEGSKRTDNAPPHFGHDSASTAAAVPVNAVALTSRQMNRRRTKDRSSSGGISAITSATVRPFKRSATPSKPKSSETGPAASVGCSDCFGAVLRGA